MRIKIQDEPVRQNVEVFLRMLRKGQEKRSIPEERVFNAWLNRKTGEFSFAKVAEGTEHLGQRDWKPVRFMYQYDPARGEIGFFVYEAEGKEEVFHSQDLTEAAFQVLKKTMKVFGQITKQLKGPSDLNTKISVLAKLIINAEVPHHDRNVIVDLWHHADRVQAESLLINLPIGTYLFRKDPFAEVLEEQLERSLGKKIRCYTLTYSQENHKITDLTFVHVGGVWQIYNDDPSLEQQSFSDLKEMTDSMKTVLRYPLYRV